MITVKMTVLNMNLGEHSYPIIIGKDLLAKANEHFDLERNVFIVTDDGVPYKYAEAIKGLCKNATVYTVKAGEASKCFGELERMLLAMSDFGLGRGDCAVAVGGGVVGDLTGFAASVYMRGIDFYNVPTTLLSQVDSSIGGKTAVDLGSIKNLVGSFKQPKAVLVDTDTLKTLPERHMRNGLAEAIKMAATFDEKLFSLFEKSSENELYENIDEVVTEALKIKKAVVEEDEKEAGLRRVLNFGHTLGHAIESHEGLGGLLHGECVALGMLPVSSGEARERILAVLKKVGLPTDYSGNVEAALHFAEHDKKVTDGGVNVVFCDKIGTFNIMRISLDKFKIIALDI